MYISIYLLMYIRLYHLPIYLCILLSISLLSIMFFHLDKSNTIAKSINHYVAQFGLELIVIFSQPLKYWYYSL